MTRERLLVNFFYSHAVGHAVEALHYCLGHHTAAPDRAVSVVLNAATACELAEYCPFVECWYPIEHPFVEPGVDSVRALEGVPRRWDWIVDDFRRRQDFQLRAFPGMHDYYEASDRHLIAERGRTVVGDWAAGYVPRCRLRLELPAAARDRALHLMRGGEGVPWIAVMPAGSGYRSLYPSIRSWRLILDALMDRLPGARFALIGKLRRDGRTASTLAPGEVADLLAHPSRPLDGFDLGLTEQLAIVEACDVFVSPHTGFGMAALAVGTPWLTISGGRWFEYYFNHVPFRSIIPDVERYPAFTQFEEPPTISDGDDGPRTPSMTLARIQDDLDRIATAAAELVDGSVTYERALAEYFNALLAAHQGDAGQIWSIDGVHAGYVAAAR
ncbi:MAG TPA: hypothetical protein VJ741_19990 [Solirubrobacteraceae bacterium]|nr:hypothetical protein [Solirubrobacteraceae bacterium]